MPFPWKKLALALAIGAACTPALAQVTYSDAEVAYVAAKLQQADFARDGTICNSRSDRKRHEATRLAYEQANPDYIAALGLPNPRQEVQDVTARELDAFDKVFKQMLPMLAMMPRGELCKNQPESTEVRNFQKRVASTRNLLAHDKPPVPEPPLTALTDAEIDPIVAAVLQHPDVAMYLHPDAPDRVPVRVALAAPYDRKKLSLTLYGAPVKTTSRNDRDAVQLTLKPHGDRCQVEVDYAPEGIHGTVDLERSNGPWRATAAKIYE